MCNVSMVRLHSVVTIYHRKTLICYCPVLVVYGLRLNIGPTSTVATFCIIDEAVHPAVLGLPWIFDYHASMTITNEGPAIRFTDGRSIYEVVQNNTQLESPPIVLADIDIAHIGVNTVDSSPSSSIVDGPPGPVNGAGHQEWGSDSSYSLTATPTVRAPDDLPIVAPTPRYDVIGNLIPELQPGEEIVREPTEPVEDRPQTDDEIVEDPTTGLFTWSTTEDNIRGSTLVRGMNGLMGRMRQVIVRDMRLAEPLIHEFVPTDPALQNERYQVMTMNGNLNGQDFHTFAVLHLPDSLEDDYVSPPTPASPEDRPPEEDHLMQRDTPPHLANELEDTASHAHEAPSRTEPTTMRSDLDSVGATDHDGAVVIVRQDLVEGEDGGEEAGIQVDEDGWPVIDLRTGPWPANFHITVYRTVQEWLESDDPTAETGSTATFIHPAGTGPPTASS